MSAERSRSVPFLLKPAKVLSPSHRIIRPPILCLAYFAYNRQLDGTLAGDEGFDPLGLSNINDLGIDLYWLREAEIKHSRVAMLAFLGIVAQELGFVAPGFVSLSSIIIAIQLFRDLKLALLPQPSGANQVTLFWSVIEQKPGPVVAAFLFLGIVECNPFCSRALLFFIHWRNSFV